MSSLSPKCSPSIILRRVLSSVRLKREVRYSVAEQNEMGVCALPGYCDVMGFDGDC